MIRTCMLAAAGAAATLVAIAPANAQYARANERGWRTVAYTRVDGRDSDTIRLRGHFRERSIRLCAINQPLRLRDFDIRFANGGHQDVNTRAVLRPARAPERSTSGATAATSPTCACATNRSCAAGSGRLSRSRCIAEDIGG
jgi:hypothetical protein